MYLVHLKALLTHSLKQVFGSQYPQADFRSDVNVGIEYPVDKQGYPGVWIDYADTAPLRQAGIGHRELATNGTLTNATRFEFAGTASFTIVTLSSLERDRLFDEMVRVLAFGRQDGATTLFRDTLENNDLLAVNGRFDEIEVGGNAAAPGTPWGTDEIIYERTISVDLLGEFVADAVAGSLLPLSAIIVNQVVDTHVGQAIADATPVGDGKGTWH